MKFNQWTVGLIATGVVSLGSAVQADEGPISTLVSGTTIGGAVDTSAQLKMGPGSTMANRFINTAPDHYNGFNLEYFEFRIEKPLDEAQWSAGYTAEMWFGPDADALPGSVSSGVAVKQALVALRAPIGNGLDFKIGLFEPIIGYEVSSAYANPNFSRSMGFALEPFGHTGLLSSYQVTEWLGVAGGIANTAFGQVNAKNPWANSDSSGPFGKGNSILTYMGAVTLQAPESWGWLAGSSLYGGLLDGGESDAKDSLNYYVGISLPTPIKEVTVGAAWDYISNPSWGDTSYASALAGYVSWQLTEKLRLNGRVEYANSGGGIFITPIRTDGETGENYYDTSGGKEKIFAFTATAEYTLWANVVSRLELVWDRDVGSGDDSFDDRKNAYLLIANIAYKF